MLGNTHYRVLVVQALVVQARKPLLEADIFILEIFWRKFADVERKRGFLSRAGQRIQYLSE